MFSKLLMSVIMTVLFTALLSACSGKDEQSLRDTPNIESIKQAITLTENERVWLAQQHKVHVRLGDWPPYMLTGEQFSGISVDYLDLAAKVHGITFDYLDEQDFSWPQTLKSLRDRTGVDMVPAINPSPERATYLAFTRSYQTLPWVIVTKKDAPFVAGLEDLENREVTVQSRFILQHQLETAFPKINLTIVESNAPTLDALKAVATGQAFATINALPVVAYFINQYGLTNLKVASPAQLPDLQLTMGVRSDWPELASILSKTFMALSTSEHAAIRDKWVSQQDIGIPVRTVVSWALVAAIVVFILLLSAAFLQATIKKNIATHTRQLNQELAERKKIESALRDSVGHIRQLAQHSPLPTAITDEKNRVQYLNDRFYETFGWTMDDLPTIEDWLKKAYPDPEYREHAYGTWQRGLRQTDFAAGERFHDEWKVTCADGSIKDIQFHYMLAGAHLVTTMIDVTGRKLAEVEREKLIAELEHKNAELERFVYTVSHDLKSPLITISGFSGKLLADVGSSIPESAKSALNHINNAAIRMNTLLGDLLQLSRIGRLDERKEEVDLNQVVSDVCDNLHAQMEATACPLELTAPLPMVWGERVRPMELYQNLIENAVKHGKTDRPLNIVLGMDQRDGETVLFVEDNGPGISKKYRNKVFGLFEQLKAHSGGSGVGLALVKRIVEHHGGRVWIEDGTNKTGTRFCFTLPGPRSKAPQQEEPTGQ